jgi:hypothetical protein
MQEKQAVEREDRTRTCQTKTDLCIKVKQRQQSIDKEYERNYEKRRKKKEKEWGRERRDLGT